MHTDTVCPKFNKKRKCCVKDHHDDADDDADDNVDCVFNGVK